MDAAEGLPECRSESPSSAAFEANGMCECVEKILPLDCSRGVNNFENYHVIVKAENEFTKTPAFARRSSLSTLKKKKSAMYGLKHEATSCME
jgi:hypothetical protein